MNGRIGTGSVVKAVVAALESPFQFLNIDGLCEEIIHAGVDAFVTVFLHSSGGECRDPWPVCHPNLK